jgi:uncharacterized circularly permuted ATP-grasp superfamily protein
VAVQQTNTGPGLQETANIYMYVYNVVVCYSTRKKNLTNLQVIRLSPLSLHRTSVFMILRLVVISHLFSY